MQDVPFDVSTILAVDDDPFVLEMISKIVSNQNIRVIKETNPLQVVEILQSVKVDLMLLDIVMPEISGLELLHDLRKSPKWMNIPVIFLSAEVNAPFILKAFKMGAIDFISKPIIAEELQTRISNHLQIIITKRQLKTEHDKWEQQLRDSEETFRAISTAAKDAIMMIGPDGRIDYWNMAVEKIFDFAPYADQGDTYFTELLEINQSSTTFRDLWDKFKDSGEAAIFEGVGEILAIKNNGIRFPIELSMSSVEIKGVWHAVAILRDITERKLAQKKLLESEQMHKIINSILRISLSSISLEPVLKRILNIVISSPIGEFEAQGSIFLYNEQTERLKMVAEVNLAEEIKEMCAVLPLGKCLCGIAAEQKKLIFCSDLDKDHTHTFPGIKPHGHYCVPIMSGKKLHGVLNIYIPSGRQKNKGEVDFLRAVCNTIAGIIERKKVEDEKERMQNKLVQTEKMASVGVLATGVAHQLNNPLAIVSNYADMIETEEDEADVMIEHAQHITEASKRMKEIIDQLRVFAAEDRRKNYHQIKLGELIGNVLLTNKKQAESLEVDLVFDTSAKDIGIWGDFRQLEKVMHILIENSLDSFARNPCPSPRTIEFKVTHDNSSQAVEICIQDNAAGIGSHILGNIFEPFFTTKGVGEGTGLGLSIALGIIKSHGGKIELESSEGNGTAIIISLPDENNQGSVEEPLAKETVDNKKNILIIDDDSEVVELLAECLEDEFKYLTASDPEKVYSIIEQGNFDIVITDIKMPEVSGIDVLFKVKNQRPDTVVILMSGYAADDHIIEEMLKQGATGVIQKPIDVDTVVDEIKNILTR